MYKSTIFMLLVKIPVKSRLLIIKFLGNQKSHADFQQHGGLAPLTWPCSRFNVKGESLRQFDNAHPRTFQKEGCKHSRLFCHNTSSITPIISHMIGKYRNNVHITEMCCFVNIFFLAFTVRIMTIELIVSPCTQVTFPSKLCPEPWAELVAGCTYCWSSETATITLSYAFVCIAPGPQVSIYM